MYFLNKIIDIIFPKDLNVLELERMSAEELEKALPATRARPEEILALFSYKDARVKTLIQEIKYNQNKNLTTKVAKLLTERSLEFFEENLSWTKQKILLVPIPTGADRQQKRGYNPPFELAKEMAKDQKEIFVAADILKKVRQTKRQAQLPRHERLTNLQGAFAVTAKASASRMAIIVDDISTTGATVSEAKRALSEAGFKTLGAVVMAH